MGEGPKGNRPIMEGPGEDKGSSFRLGQQGQSAQEALALVILLGGAAVLLFTSIVVFQTPDLGSNLSAGLLAVAGLLPAAWILWAMERRERAAKAYDQLARIAAWFDLEPVFLLIYVLAPILALGAWSVTGNAPLVHFPGLTALLWLGALATVLLPTFLSQQEGLRLPQLSRNELVLIIGLVGAAFVLRTYRLAEIPWLFTGDEGAAALSSVDLIKGRWNNPFTVAWFSFPSLYFVIPAASIRLFGQTITAARLSSAVAGALTVLALYAYVRVAFDRRAALLATVLLAASDYHIHFSRIALNNIWDPLFFVLVSGTLWHAWRQRQPHHFAWPGVALGLSLYFYASARALPVMVLVWLIWAGIQNRDALRDRIPGIVVMVAGFCAAALPLVMFFITHPGEFNAPLSRVSRIGVWMQGIADGEITAVATEFFNQLLTSVLAFTGVSPGQLYQTGYPLLFPLEATLFSLGFILVLIRIQDLRHFWLILWLLTGVVASTLSIGAPSSQRYVHVAPALAVLVALPLVAALDWLPGFLRSGRRWALGLISIIMVLAVFRNISFYFFEYSPGHQFGDPNTEAANVLADHLQEWPSGSKVVFLAGGISFTSHKSVEYLAPHVTGENIHETLPPDPSFKLDGPTLFVAVPERDEELARLQTEYPGGSRQPLMGDEGETLLLAYGLRAQ